MLWDRDLEKGGVYDMYNIGLDSGSQSDRFASLVKIYLDVQRYIYEASVIFAEVHKY